MLPRQREALLDNEPLWIGGGHRRQNQAHEFRPQAEMLPRRPCGAERSGGERTIPRLRRRIGRFACTLTVRESCNYFRHAG